MSERGSSAVEAIFAIVFLMVLSLGVMEVVFALYARNVVSSSAHEAARAALEVGHDPDSAALIARRTVLQAAGGLVNDLEVEVRAAARGGRRVVEVLISGRTAPFGPVPIPVPLSITASAVQDLPRR